jgi:hypothetical protein
MILGRRVIPSQIDEEFENRVELPALSRGEVNLRAVCPAFEGDRDRGRAIRPLIA